jgi:hypothetical protein
MFGVDVNAIFEIPPPQKVYSNKLEILLKRVLRIANLNSFFIPA